MVAQLATRRSHNPTVVSSDLARCAFSKSCFMYCQRPSSDDLVTKGPALPKTFVFSNGEIEGITLLGNRRQFIT